MVFHDDDNSLSGSETDSELERPDSDGSDELEDNKDDNSRVQWSEEQLEVLQRRVKDYQKATVKAKRLVIEGALADLSSVPGTSTSGNDLRELVVEWYQSNAGRPKVKVGKKPSRRMVVSYTKRAEIQQMIPLMDVATNLAAHSKAVSQIMKTMTPEELKEVDVLREEWMNKGPPKAEQRKRAKNRLAGEVLKFARKIYLEMGVRVAVLTGWEGEGKQKRWAMHEFNDSIGSGKPSFREEHPDWDTGNTASLWTDYVNEYLSGDEDEPAEPIAVTGPKAKLLGVKGGLPVLSDGCLHNTCGLARGAFSNRQRSMLREYVVGHYKVASGNRARTVPWTEMKENPTKFIDAEYLPELNEVNIKLSEPSHMAIREVQECLRMWYHRQTKGEEIPFAFKAWLNKRGGLNTMVEAEVVDSMAEDSNSDEGSETARPVKRPVTKPKKPKSKKKLAPVWVEVDDSMIDPVLRNPMEVKQEAWDELADPLAWEFEEPPSDPPHPTSLVPGNHTPTIRTVPHPAGMQPANDFWDDNWAYTGGGDVPAVGHEAELPVLEEAARMYQAMSDPVQPDWLPQLKQSWDPTPKKNVDHELPAMIPSGAGPEDVKQKGKGKKRAILEPAPSEQSPVKRRKIDKTPMPPRDAPKRTIREPRRQPEDWIVPKNQTKDNTPVKKVRKGSKRR